MTDLAKARELAQRLGYTPQQPTNIYVNASTPPVRLAQYRAAGLNPVYQEDLDREHAVAAGTRLAETDPRSFRRWLDDELQSRPSITAAASRRATPTIMEVPPLTVIDVGGTIQIDRLSLTPAATSTGRRCPAQHSPTQNPCNLPAITAGASTPTN